jgi:hypothetical protein
MFLSVLQMIYLFVFLGTVFVPDSIGFFIGCNAGGFLSYKLGSWRVALSSLLLAGVSLFAVKIFIFSQSDSILCFSLKKIAFLRKST